MDKEKSNIEKIGDVQAKILARDRRIVARILHDYIPEYKGIPAEEIASRYLVGDAKIREKKVMPPLFPGGLTESSIPNEGSVYFDVIIDALAPDAEGKETIRLIFNFEVQNDPHPGYPLPKRGEYYVARMISQQYGEEFVRADYGRLKKVYSVWIVPYAPASWGNNVLVFPGEHAPRVLAGKNHYDRKDYGLWNYILLEIGDPKTLKENRDALGLLSVLFSLTMKTEEQIKTLDEQFDFRVDEHEAEELENMQAMMMSISEVYRERMEAEIQDIRDQMDAREKQAREQLDMQRRQAQEQLDMQLRQAQEQLDMQKRQAQEQLNAQEKQAREQAIANYIDAGIRFGANPDELCEAVRDQFGIQDAEAVTWIQKVQSKRNALDQVPSGGVPL